MSIDTHRPIEQDLALEDTFLEQVSGLRIDPSLSVTTLLALHSIYVARYELSGVENDNRSLSLFRICSMRMDEIAAALRKKYDRLEEGNIGVRIEILESIESIRSFNGNETDVFASHEIERLSSMPGLNTGQKLRLSIISGVTDPDLTLRLSELMENLDSVHDIVTASILMPFYGNEAWDQQLTARLSSICREAERSDNRSGLLTLAYSGRVLWNDTPQRQLILTSLADRLRDTPTLTHPERLVLSKIIEGIKTIRQLTLVA